MTKGTNDMKGDYMPFYKLFCVMNRLTDWYEFLKWARELIYPELFEKKIKRETMELLFARPYLEMLAHQEDFIWG